VTDGRDADTPADPRRDDPSVDAPEGPEAERSRRPPASPPSVPEGVRIIGAEEAQAALETGQASPRKAENEMRFGDVPPRPDPSVRPAARFPSPAVPPSPGDDTAARPVVPRVASPSAVPPAARPRDEGPRAPASAVRPTGDAPEADPGPGVGPREAPDDAPAPRPGALFDPPAGVSGDDTGHDRGHDTADDSIEVLFGGDEEGAVETRPEPHPGAAPDREPDREPTTGGDASAPLPLPHWTAPPTGEVPRILPEAEPVDMTDEEDFAAWAALAGGEPRFRSRAGDWDDDEAALVEALGAGAGEPAEALGALSEAEPVDDDSEFAEQVARRRRIRSRSAARADLVPPVEPAVAEPGADRPLGDVHVEAPGGAAEEAAPSAGRAGGPTSRRIPRAAEAAEAAEAARHGTRRPLPAPPTPEPAPRGPDLATRVVTGVAVAVVGLVCLKLGAGATTVLAAVIVGTATFELYEGLRRATFRPAAILGILGTVGLVFAAYKRGDAAFPLITVLVVAFTLLWYLVEVVRARPVVNVGATLLGFGYVGVLGGFAGLILALPHGVGIVLGLVISAVGYDVFGFLIGSQFGRTRLAPTISPQKTVEGLIGGMSAALVLGVVTSSVIGLHPWAPSVGRGLALGAVVAVMAPLGDLCESMIKRDLRVKDLGSVLPGHGGVLDRFDAILFCLPAVYYLARHLFG